MIIRLTIPGLGFMVNPSDLKSDHPLRKIANPLSLIIRQILEF